MIEAMGGQTVLDILAQLHSGFSYRGYSLRGFNRAFSGDRFAFDQEIEWFQKIRHASGRQAKRPALCSSGRTTHSSIIRQSVYNNAAVVHIVILDGIQLPVQSPDWLIYYGERIVTKYEHFVNCQLKRT